MLRYVVVFAASLAVLFFIAGCPSTGQRPQVVQTPSLEPIGSEQTENPTPSPPPAQLEPPAPKPNETAPAVVEAPAAIETPAVIEPVITEQQTEPPAGGPDGNEPNEIEPNYPEPSEPEAAPNETNTVSAEINTAPAQPQAAPNEPQPQQIEYESASDFHQKCADLLKTYVNEKGYVDYAALSRRKPELTKLLNEFRDLDPAVYGRWSAEDKTAFWLNAYNLELLKIIIDNYPIQSSRILRLFWPPNSIRHIKGLWDRHKFIVMDEQFTLREVERRFFRKQFGDPRIFFAMSFASVSSPPMRNEPYYGSKLSEQLDDQVKKYLSGRYGLKIDAKNGEVRLSVIFKWYAGLFVEKFGTDKQFKDQSPALRAVLNFITNYVSQRDKTYLQTANYSVGYLRYDWTLNE